MEEFLKKRLEGGTIIGKMKIFTLAYADDMAMMAESEKEMEKILRALKKYLEEKGLQLNTTKSKTMVCSKRDSGKHLGKWTWNNKNIEEVEEFKCI